MQKLLSVLSVLSLVYGGDGVKKSSGVKDFWTDDYKVFEQIYGKTSDRDLYGETLPSTLADLGKKKPEASEKKERYIDSQAFSDFDSYSFGDRYAKIFAKQILGEGIGTTKPPKTLNFISYPNFKPISKETDPETYNYLKHLEEFNKEKAVKLPKGSGGFKPYLSHGDSGVFNDDSEEQQAYRSIQDILDAHEANKGGKNDDSDSDEQIKYLTNGSGKSKKTNVRKKLGGDKPRCWSGRCRKRAVSTVRVRSRPYIRKIIQNRWH